MEIVAAVAAALTTALLGFVWRQNGRVTSLEVCQKECRPQVNKHLGETYHISKTEFTDLLTRLGRIESRLMAVSRAVNGQSQRSNN